MSTASPDTCADVSGDATQRAASSAEPYFATASRRSRAWYSGERQPLSTRNATPLSVAAWRRAPRSAGSSLATPGISSSKTVVPSGTTDDAVVPDGDGVESENPAGVEDASTRWPRA